MLFLLPFENAVLHEGISTVVLRPDSSPRGVGAARIRATGLTLGLPARNGLFP
jgi:hypothetical protein